MKLLRVAAAIGIVAWLNRKFGAKALQRVRSAQKVAGLQTPHMRVRVRHPQGTRPSAASAASGAYRDDRDVAGVGVLRDEEATRP